MAKEPLLELEGVVRESLPNVMFRVELDNGHLILCTSSGNMKRNFIKILEGDRVRLEMSPYDMTRGRINKRLTGNKRDEDTQDKKKKSKGKK